MAVAKTNALRILDKEKVSYHVYEYDASDGKIDGVSVAHKTNTPPELVFKTLVTVGASKTYYVFVIPVENELPLKEAAKAVGEKNIEMIKVADIEKITGYIRGGCSPIGMKKQFKTVLHSSSLIHPKIIVSAGKIGMQMELDPNDLIRMVGAQVSDL